MVSFSANNENNVGESNRIESFDEVLNRTVEQMWNENREDYLKRNLTAEEACKEAYKTGIISVLFNIWGMGYEWQHLKHAEKRKKDQEEFEKLIATS